MYCKTVMPIHEDRERARMFVSMCERVCACMGVYMRCIQKCVYPVWIAMVIVLKGSPIKAKPFSIRVTSATKRFVEPLFWTEDKIDKRRNVYFGFDANTHYQRIIPLPRH